MPAEYTQFDKDLAAAVVFRFNGVSTDGLLSGINNDNPLAGLGGGLTAGLNEERIPFQFPPKITSDNRKGDWHEDNIPGNEPVAVYEKSGPREISLTWTYIIDGGEWTTNKVSRIVKKLRGYFARTRDTTNFGQRGLVVFFKMWNFGDPNKEMSCRIRSVDVKHSDTIVTHCGGSNRRINEAYPLRTDITVELRIWTKGGQNETQDVPGLKKEEQPLWY